MEGNVKLEKKSISHGLSCISKTTPTIGFSNKLDIEGYWSHLKLVVKSWDYCPTTLQPQAY